MAKNKRDYNALTKTCKDLNYPFIVKITLHSFILCSFMVLGYCEEQAMYILVKRKVLKIYTKMLMILFLEWLD